MAARKRFSVQLREMLLLPGINADSYEATYGPTCLRSSNGTKSVSRVVIIPDIDAGGAEKWSDGSQCWLKTLLPCMLSKPYILEYAHGFQIGEDFVVAGEYVHLCSRRHALGTVTIKDTRRRGFSVHESYHDSHETLIDNHSSKDGQ